MPKTATLPATSEAVALLTRALTQGHAVTISLVAPPRVDCTTPPATICSLRFGLTGIEGLILAELTSHPRVSREDMCRAVSHHSKAVSKFGTVSVALCTLRKKMRLHDVDIITDRMQGFRLTAESRDKIQKLIAGMTCAAAATNLNPVAPRDRHESNNTIKKRDPPGGDHQTGRSRKAIKDRASLI